jgi:cation diffusion facilitator family transporter
MDAVSTSAPSTGNGGVRLRAALASLLVGIVLLAGKYVGYLHTGSAAVLSDALESIVNVVAASFMVASVIFAGKPADRDHPYGHGKIEFFSAVFEGGLISFAAVLIAWYAIMDLVRGPAVREVELGMLITLACGLGNAALGWYLITTGRREQSLSLIADGHHVLSDFWTSAGVVVGLLLVRVTGLTWLDPVTAIVVAVNLVMTGARLVREAAGGLLDEEDSALLAELVGAFERGRDPGLIRIHSLRAIRAGRFTHVDAHLIVPEYWTVEQAHHVVDAFEQRVLDSCSVEGEIAFHTDPCARALCSLCELAECPVRQAPLGERPPLTVEEARLSDALFWRRYGVDQGPDLARRTG